VYELDRAEGVASEATVLVGVVLPGGQAADAALEELEGLAAAAGARVVGQLVQRREAPDTTTYLGSGKVEELRRLVDRTDADAVIFDNDLSPGQTRNLERALSVKVLDRTELILDIFATRAQTYEARLAVELAQLEYSMPRLKRMWTHLSRYTAGIGVRGPGEKQLEVDRRLVEKRINELRNELRAVQRRKEREVAGRSDHLTVCLVGYTNAGKSTLLNALTGADVLVRDALFATLPGWGPILLSDTVGFVRNLPHQLIASFKATLEEARQANLLLHVADASSPAVEEQISAAFGVLDEIGLRQKDTLLVLNKVDMLPDSQRLDGLMNRYSNAIPISARSGAGLDRLAAAVADALSRAFLDVDVEMGVDNGWAQAYLAAHGEVLSKRYTDSHVIVHCRIPRSHLNRMDRGGISVRVHHANGTGEVQNLPGQAVEDVA
jgi:GTP-binding protein HflX